MVQASYPLQIQNQQLITDSGAPSWTRLYVSYLAYFEQHPAQSWTLYEADCYYFSALFLALLAANKTLVLPQNGQAEHLKWVNAETDGFANATELEKALDKDYRSAPEQLDIQIPLAADVLLYTSGSSGTPKQIVKKAVQLFTEVDALEQHFGEQVNDTVFLSTVSHQHVYGLLFKVLWPLAKQHRFVCKSFEYPEHIRHYLQTWPQQQATLLSSPAHLHRICEDNVLKPVAPQLHLLFSSGGPLNSGKNLRLQKELSCRITEVYGSTETGGIAWRQLQKNGSESWAAFQGIEIKACADTQQLAIRSPYLLEPDWYLADDRIALDSAQGFRLLGRVDRVVKVEEKRVSLDEVQTKLVTHDWVKESFVLVTGDVTQKLAAVIVLNSNGQKYLNEKGKLAVNRTFRDYLLSWFEPVLLPKKYRYIAELPCNSQGKLNKKELEALFV